jgi:type IV pilus assembly protein PilV
MTARRRQPQLGIGLIEALVALAVLSFGLLGMVRFQARIVQHGSESQARLQAMQLGDELLNLALVDTRNAGCYTLPAAGGCGSGIARTTTQAWARRVGDALPGGTAPVSTLANGRLTVQLRWTAPQTGAQHVLEAVTDVRQNP